ncbi:MAG TPA: pitrilysin family protein [Polyangiaceae bacterium]
MKRALLLLAAIACNDMPPVNVPGPTVAHPAGASIESPETRGAVATLARRNPSARVVAFRIAFDTGSSEDPTGKEGLTALTAAMTVKSGTRALTFAELSRALYPMAASIGVDVDRDETVFSADVAAADLPKFYPLLRDVILSPRFDDESFKRLRARQKSSLDDELKGADDESLGKEALQAAIYADHPYGHPADGTDAGLAALTLEDVKAQRARVFCKDRVTVGVAGAYPEGFDKTIARDLDALPACPGPRPGLPEPQRHHGLRVVLVDKPSADATAISIGFPTTMTRASEDFPAAYFFTSFLGQHRQSSGVLYHDLREVRGLNYGDYAYAEYFEQDGDSRFTLPNIVRREQLVSIWLRPVKPANGLFALRGALYDWEKYVEGGIPDAEITRFANFLSRYQSLEQQTESRRLGFALDDRSYHLATPFMERMRAAWSTLDGKKLAQVVKRDLASGDMTIAIVTKNAAALKKTLVSGEKTPPTYDSPKPKSVTDEDKIIEAFPLHLKDADVTIVPIADLFAK